MHVFISVYIETKSVNSGFDAGSIWDTPTVRVNSTAVSYTISGYNCKYKSLQPTKPSKALVVIISNVH